MYYLYKKCFCAILENGGGKNVGGKNVGKFVYKHTKKERFLNKFNLFCTSFGFQFINSGYII